MKTHPDDLCSGNGRVIYGPQNHVTQIMGVGLTKREYFAAIAMQGMLAKQPDRHFRKKIALYAVEHADNLIENLNKGKS